MAQGLLHLSLDQHGSQKSGPGDGIGAGQWRREDPPLTLGILVSVAAISTVTKNNF